MFNRSCIVLGAMTALAFVSACSKPQDTTPCVATPTVTLSKDRFAISSPLKATYRFDVAQNAQISGEYAVFVHVMDDQGEQLWGDDHAPDPPTTQWKPGQKVEYTRTVFVPNYPYIGPAHIRIGLYQPGSPQRLPLCATDAARREYEVTKFQLVGQAENIFIIYKDGWHTAEVNSQNPTDEWQWTKKAGSISFKNPKKDATFYLEYDARTDKFPTPQQVTIRSGDQVIATFTADAAVKKPVAFPVTAAQLGTGDMSELTIEVDQTFAPGGTDTRELGIRVYHAFVEPKN
jgi:hypothetical protein